MSYLIWHQHRRVMSDDQKSDHRLRDVVPVMD